MKIESAHSLVRLSDTAISLMVKFAEFDAEVPFTASPDDATDYGREIYQNAVNGDYGAIATG